MPKAIIFWILCPILMATGLFHIKHEVQRLEDKLTDIKHKIVSTQEGIAVAQAEWVHLTAPGRLAQLNEKHLHLVPTEPKHIVNLGKLRETQIVQTAGKK